MYSRDKSYWHSADKLGYSGVATFSKKEPLHVQYGLGIDKYDKEGRVLITEFDNFLLYNIYFPNGQKDEIRLQYKLDFYDDLLEILDDQVASGNNVIVAGDWNTAHKEIDLARPKQNQKTSGFLEVERKWIDSFVENGFEDVFRNYNSEPDWYTYWDQKSRARERNVGWRIDYFFVHSSAINLVKGAEILNKIEGSDHCPIMLDLV